MNMIRNLHEHKRPFTSIRASCERYQLQATQSNWYTNHPLHKFGSHSYFFSLLLLLSLFLLISFVFFLCSRRNYFVDLLRVYWIKTYPSMFHCHLMQPIIYFVTWLIQFRAIIAWQYEPYAIDIDCWWRRWFLSFRASIMMSSGKKRFCFKFSFSAYSFICNIFFFSFFLTVSLGQSPLKTF